MPIAAIIGGSAEIGSVSFSTNILMASMALPAASIDARRSVTPARAFSVTVDALAAAGAAFCAPATKK